MKKYVNWVAKAQDAEKKGDWANDFNAKIEELKQKHPNLAAKLDAITKVFSHQRLKFGVLIIFNMLNEVTDKDQRIDILKTGIDLIELSSKFEIVQLTIENKPDVVTLAAGAFQLAKDIDTYNARLRNLAMLVLKGKE